MQKYRAKNTFTFEAIQLTWENWDEICQFVGVGKLSEGRPERVFLTESGDILPKGHTSDHIGLIIPKKDEQLVVLEGEWIVDYAGGDLVKIDNDTFLQIYEPINAEI